VALIRAFSAFLGRPLADARVSALAYAVEKIHHGSPSGIDNTVITHAQPVFFQRGKDGQEDLIETFQVAAPFILLIGDTGIPSVTSIAVGDLRSLWQADSGQYEALFDAAGRIAVSARALIERGEPEGLGPLMDENQVLLRQMQVSSPELEHLVKAARQAGALGAKLSGAGRGGNMIALVQTETAACVEQALIEAGAVRVISTTVS
jgi:mevalonate kinase